MCSCQPLNRNPEGAPAIQKLTIQDLRGNKSENIEMIIRKGLRALWLVLQQLYTETIWSEREGR